MKDNKLSTLIVLLSGLAGLHQAGATMIANPSFETGDFTGWETQEIFSFFPMSVDGAGEGPGFGFFQSDPTDGNFTAMHNFDGVGPGSIRIGQDLLITQNFINFDLRAAWNLNFGATEVRLVDVNIEEAGGGANIFNQNLLMADPFSNPTVFDTGNITASIDVSAFLGQTVRFSVDSFIPETFTGPAFVTIDNFTASDDSVKPVPESATATMLLLGGGLAGIMFLSKRKKVA